MTGSKWRVVSVLVICALVCVLAIGCVKSKPPREREALPTLPAIEVAQAEVAAAAEGESTSEAETTEAGTETPAAEETTASPTEEPTLEPTEVPTPTTEPTPYAGPVYVVLPGDSLGTIAEAHGTTVAAFMEANDLSSITLRVGQVLRLPEGVEPLWDLEPENTAIHIVKPGETLNDISARYRMPVGQIMALNRWLTDPSLLRPGKELVVVVQPLDPNAIIHVVQPGESLGTIAAQYGVSVSALQEANYIVDPNRLSVGQELVIPR